jgi:hypothetical protein
MAAEGMANREIAQACSLPSSREKLPAALEL